MEFGEGGVGDGLDAIANVELVGVEGKAGGKVEAHEVGNHGIAGGVAGDLILSETVAAFGDSPAGLLEGGAEGCAREDLPMQGSDGGIEEGGVGICEFDESEGAGGGDAVVGAVEIGDAEGVGLVEEIDVVGAKTPFDAFAVEQLVWCVRAGRRGRDHALSQFSLRVDFWCGIGLSLEEVVGKAEGDKLFVGCQDLWGDGLFGLVAEGGVFQDALEVADDFGDHFFGSVAGGGAVEEMGVGGAAVDVQVGPEEAAGGVGAPVHVGFGDECGGAQGEALFFAEGFREADIVAGVGCS